MIFKGRYYEVPEDCGYVRNEEAIAQASSELEFPTFGDTPAGQDVTPIPNRVHLWDAARKILGKLIPGRNQGPVGTCVSFGVVAKIEYTLAALIAAGAVNMTWQEMCQEYVYAGSRVEIGGMRSFGDGSNGVWATKLITDTRYGCIPRGVFLNGKYNLTEYSPNLARKWGAPGVGIPNDLEPVGRLRYFKTFTKITNFDEACRAIANGSAVSVCSNQGFNRYVRDKDGFCVPSGIWNHCLCLIGYTKVGRAGGFLLNSYGDKTHTGPLGEGDGPPAGFWSDADVVDRMLRQGDSWAIAGPEGFQPKVIDWSNLKW